VPERKKIPDNIVAEILVSSKRRCCICVAVRNDATEKRGQIAHLDHDPSNNRIDNLAFLCLDHHDQYDSRSSQSKGYTLEEVKRYRALLVSSAESPQAILPDVRVSASTAIAGVRSGGVEVILGIEIKNYSAAPVLIRSIMLELSTKQLLFFAQDYLTDEYNSRRELRSGERMSFHLSLEGLFHADRTPESFHAVVVHDEIDREFRFEGEAFYNVVTALYSQYAEVRRNDREGS
jgi:hypothetical protein